MTLPPPIEDDDERFAAWHASATRSDFVALREDDRRRMIAPGRRGPTRVLHLVLDEDDVELATVVVDDVDMSASSPLSQNSMMMMARQTSPNIPATMAYTRADWTVP